MSKYPSYSVDGADYTAYELLSPRGKAEVDRFLAFQSWSDGNMFKEES